MAHGVTADLWRERAALRATLVAVGPDAPTSCGTWTTTDLAVHVVVGEINGGVATVPFRYLVSRGVRLDRVAGLNRRALAGYRRRHGFEWALERLARPAPRAHRLGHRVAPVSLLEMWAHHEDVLNANGLGPCGSGVDLAPVVQVLLRYQRRVLAAHGLEVPPGSPAEVARWLSGRARHEDLPIDLSV